jgi:hypothetical protein
LENPTVEAGQDRPGPILYRHGTKQNTKHICEGGVRDNWASISWDDIESIFVDATELVPLGEGLTVRIVSTKGNEITFTQEGFLKIRDEEKSDFSNLYGFIVSKVIDRQWTQLLRDIEEGKKVTFGRFFVFSSAIYQEKFFGGYDTIGLDRVVGCDSANGELSVDFLDDKRHLKRKKFGPVSEIPNIHLVKAFLSSMAQKNSGR